MNDVELGAKGKAAFGAACVVCCAAPMLVVLGVISVGMFLAAGAGVGAAVAVAALAYAVASRRVASAPVITRRALAVVGGVVAVFGLWAATSDETRFAAPLLATGVAALAGSALLVLVGALPTRRT